MVQLVLAAHVIVTIIVYTKSFARQKPRSIVPCPLPRRPIRTPDCHEITIISTYTSCPHQKCGKAEPPAAGWDEGYMYADDKKEFCLRRIPAKRVTPTEVKRVWGTPPIGPSHTGSRM